MFYGLPTTVASKWKMIFIGWLFCHSHNTWRDSKCSEMNEMTSEWVKKHRILIQNYSNQSQNSFIDIVSMLYSICYSVGLKFQMRKVFHVVQCRTTPIFPSRLNGRDYFLNDFVVVVIFRKLVVWLLYQ